jgi:hypothetical protein
LLGCFSGRQGIFAVFQAYVGRYPKGSIGQPG